MKHTPTDLQSLTELRRLRDMIAATYSTEQERAERYWQLFMTTLDSAPDSQFVELRGWVNTTGMFEEERTLFLWRDLHSTVELGRFVK
jgi:hypothetical protein